MANKISRREILGLGAATIAGGVAMLGKGEPGESTHGGGSAQYQPATGQQKSQGGRPYWEKSYSGGPIDVKALPPVLPGKGYKPVVIPNGGALPFKIVDGVKVFHLIAEEVDHAFDSGLARQVLGIQRPCEQHRDRGGRGRADTDLRDQPFAGRRPRFIGMGFISPTAWTAWAVSRSPTSKPGETAKYEWTLRQYGSFMFHSHHDEMTQMGMGLIGMFIIHPRNPSPEYRVDRDFSLMISEWAIEAGTARPNTLVMNDFNILTINGKVFPSTAPLVCKTGDKVRLRLGNLGAMDHHPMHIHGYHFRITATDGEDIPLSAQWPETTALVAVGQTRNVEFIADAPGDWAFHCHMTHHVMNQMGHQFPNMVGMKTEGLEEKLRPLLPAYMTMGHTGMDMGRMAEVMPYPPNTIAMKGAPGPFGDYISMGGLFTVVKVRDQLKSYDEDPGWYKHPPGTVAMKASDADLARDGIDVKKLTASDAASPSNGGMKH